MPEKKQGSGSDSDEARGQAADRNANKDENRGRDKCLLAELPAYASMTDAQFDIVMTDAISEHETYRCSPFLDLPFEIRCLT